MTSARAAVLPYGAFFGRCEGRRQAGAFELASLLPTVPEPEVRLHTHAEAHFVLVLEGRYVSTAAGAPEVGGPGLLIYNPPGTTHRDRFRGEGGRFFTISVPAAVLHELGSPLELPDQPVATSTPASLAALAMARHPPTIDASTSLDLEARGVELLNLLVNDQAANRPTPPPWLARARAFLHDECGREHLLRDVARQVGVHPVHLTRAFRRHHRCTPGQYLRRCRLNRAAALLLGGRASLVEISLECGYYDQAHFSHSFRLAFGLSPREYRAHARGTRSPNPIV